MTLPPNQLCDLRHLSSSCLLSLPPLLSPSPSFTLAEAAKVPGLPLSLVSATQSLLHGVWIQPRGG